MASQYRPGRFHVPRCGAQTWPMWSVGTVWALLQLRFARPVLTGAILPTTAAASTLPSQLRRMLSLLSCIATPTM